MADAWYVWWSRICASIMHVLDFRSEMASCRLSALTSQRNSWPIEHTTMIPHARDLTLIMSKISMSYMVSQTCITDVVIFSLAPQTYGANPSLSFLDLSIVIVVVTTRLSYCAG